MTAPRRLFGSGDPPAARTLGEALSGADGRPRVASREPLLGAVWAGREPDGAARAEAEEETARARVGRAEREAKAARDELEQLRERYRAGVDALAAAARRLDAAVGADAVDIALVIARELVGREIAADRDWLSDQVSAALAALPASAAEGGARGRARLRLSEVDAAQWRDQPAIGAAIGVALEVVADPSLEPGSFCLETAEHTLDGSLDARLREVERAVRTALAGELARAA